MEDRKPKMEVTPIINVGLATTDPPTILPFMHVKLWLDGTVKTLLLNYTFGEVLSGEGRNEPVLKFESQIGELKEKLFQRISPLGRRVAFSQVVFLEGNTAESIESQMRGIIYKAPNETKVLFVYKRDDIDDVPFYTVLGLRTDKGVDPSAAKPPRTLSDLGYSVVEPFKEIEELSSGKR